MGKHLPPARVDAKRSLLSAMARGGEAYKATDAEKWYSDGIINGYWSSVVDLFEAKGAEKIKNRGQMLSRTESRIKSENKKYRKRNALPGYHAAVSSRLPHLHSGPLALVRTIDPKRFTPLKRQQGCPLPWPGTI